MDQNLFAQVQSAQYLDPTGKRLQLQSLYNQGYNDSQILNAAGSLGLGWNQNDLNYVAQRNQFAPVAEPPSVPPVSVTFGGNSQPVNQNVGLISTVLNSVASQPSAPQPAVQAAQAFNQVVPQPPSVPPVVAAPTVAPTPAPTTSPLVNASGGPTVDQAKQFIQQILSNQNLTSSQKAKALNEAALSNGVSREQLAQLSGYSLDDVNYFLDQRGVTDLQNALQANKLNNELGQLQAYNFDRSADSYDGGVEGATNARIEELKSQLGQLGDTSKIDTKGLIKKLLDEGDYETLNRIYGDTYDDSLKFLSDIGVNRGGKDEQRILAASPTGYGGAQKFDPVFGTEYYRPVLEQVGDALGLNRQEVAKTAAKYMQDNFYGDQKKRMEIVAESPQILTDLTRQLIEKTGQNSFDPKFQKLLEGVGNTGGKIADGLFSQSNSSGFIKQVLKDVDSGLGFIDDALIAAIPGVGPAALAGYKASTALANDLSLKDAAKAAAIAGGSAYLGNTISSATGGAASEILKTIGVTNDIINGALSNGINSAIGSVGPSLLTGGDVSENMKNAFITSALASGATGLIKSVANPPTSSVDYSLATNNVSNAQTSAEGFTSPDYSLSTGVSSQNLNLNSNRPLADTGGLGIKVPAGFDIAPNVQTPNGFTGVTDPIDTSFSLSPTTVANDNLGSGLKPGVTQNQTVGLGQGVAPVNPATGQRDLGGEGLKAPSPAPAPSTTQVPVSATNAPADTKYVENVVKQVANGTGVNVTQPATINNPNPVASTPTVAAVDKILINAFGFGEGASSGYTRSRSTGNGVAARMNLDSAVGAGSTQKYINDGLIARFLNGR